MRIIYPLSRLLQAKTSAEVPLVSIADPNVSTAGGRLDCIEDADFLGMTVYEQQKITVYRQKYRHQTADLARFNDTPVDSRYDKN